MAIRTTGQQRTREAVGYVVPLDTDWWDETQHTLHVDWVNPGIYCSETISRPVLALGDDNGTVILTVEDKPDGKVELLRYYSLEIGDGTYMPVAIYQDVFDAVDDTWLQLTHGIDDEQILTLFLDQSGLNLATPSQWQPGTYLYIGCDPDGNSLEGYIRSVVVYPQRATEDEATFMNGEEIHG